MRTLNDGPSVITVLNNRVPFVAWYSLDN